MRRKPNPVGARLVRLAPGIALPEYMSFLLELCRPCGYTRRAVEAGGLLNVDYHPYYVELECGDLEAAARLAEERGLRVYRGRRHVTVTDGVYYVRLYGPQGEG